MKNKAKFLISKRKLCYTYSKINKNSGAGRIEYHNLLTTLFAQTQLIIMQACFII